jgi:hypothetical protein
VKHLTSQSSRIRFRFIGESSLIFSLPGFFAFLARFLHLPPLHLYITQFMDEAGRVRQAVLEGTMKGFRFLPLPGLVLFFTTSPGR